MTIPVSSLLETSSALAEGRETARRLLDVARSQDRWNCVESYAPDADAAVAESDRRRSSGLAVSILDGIPFGVKSNFAVYGMPTTTGTSALAPAETRDASIVRRLRRLGAVVAFTTTMAPIALGAVTDSPLRGACLNPRDLKRTAGGSSGGSAAAVAAGLVSFAVGSDTLGSTRIPASYCGVTGLKPSWGALPRAGVTPLCPSLDTVGLIARTARDLAALWELLCKSNDGSAPLVDDTLGRAAAPMSGVRIAIPDFAGDADEVALDELHASVRHFENVGCSVQRTVPTGIDPQAARRAGLLFVESDASAIFRALTDTRPGSLPESTLSMLAFGRALPPARLHAARHVMAGLRAATGRLMAEFDYLLLPVTPNAVPPIGTDPADAANLTAWVNLAGLPALAMRPCVARTAGQRGATALSRGVQLVGRHGADAALLRLASCVEASGCRH